MKRKVIWCLIVLLSGVSMTASAQEAQPETNGSYCGIARDGDDQQAMYLSSQIFFTDKVGRVGLFGLGYHYVIARFVRTGGLLQLAIKDMGSTSQKFGLNVTYTLGVQLPIALGKARLTPYITPDVGITYFFNDDRWTMLNYGMFAGLEFGLPLGEASLIIGADYDLQGLTKIGRTNSPSFSEGMIHGVGAHLGIAF